MKTIEAKQATAPEIKASIDAAAAVVLQEIADAPNDTLVSKIVRGDGYSVQVVVEFNKERR